MAVLVQGSNHEGNKRKTREDMPGLRGEERNHPNRAWSPPYNFCTGTSCHTEHPCSTFTGTCHIDPVRCGIRLVGALQVNSVCVKNGVFM